MSRFVEIPTARIESLLEEIGTRITETGGSYGWTIQGRERIFEFMPYTSRPVHTRAKVRIFTSVGIGKSTARACGTDAIRIIVGAVIDTPDGQTFRPLEKGVKILRTAPKGNGADRIDAFIERFRSAIRDSYKRAVRVITCPDCGAPMAKRAGKNGQFLGCTTYPACRATRPIARP